VNLAFLNGWWNAVRGRRIESWHREDWAATSGTAPASGASASPRD
jgi:hypothetical protein